MNEIKRFIFLSTSASLKTGKTSQEEATEPNVLLFLCVSVSLVGKFGRNCKSLLWLLCNFLGIPRDAAQFASVTVICGIANIESPWCVTWVSDAQMRIYAGFAEIFNMNVNAG